MAVQLNCPGCKAPLTITPDLYGQSVRCPACSAILKVPHPKPTRSGVHPPPQPAPPQPAPQQPPPLPQPTPAAADDGTPFDFGGPLGQPAAAEPEFAEPELVDDEEDAFDEPRRQPRGSGVGRGWPSVVSGLWFINLGTVIGFAGLAFGIALILIDDDLGVVAGILGGLGFLGGITLFVLGLMQCKGIPRTTGLKDVVDPAAIGNLIGAVGMLLAIVMALIAFSTEEFGLLLVMLILMLVALIALIAGFVFYVFFLVLLAEHLQDLRLRNSVIHLMVAMSVLPIVASVLTAFTGAMAKSLSDLENAVLVMQLIIIACQIGIVVWHFIVINRLGAVVFRRRVKERH